MNHQWDLAAKKANAILGSINRHIVSKFWDSTVLFYHGLGKSYPNNIFSSAQHILKGFQNLEKEGQWGWLKIKLKTDKKKVVIEWLERNNSEESQAIFSIILEFRIYNKFAGGLVTRRQISTECLNTTMRTV